MKILAAALAVASLSVAATSHAAVECPRNYEKTCIYLNASDLTPGNVQIATGSGPLSRLQSQNEASVLATLQSRANSEYLIVAACTRIVDQETLAIDTVSHIWTPVVNTTGTSECGTY
jgi:hypothetical protein